MRAMEGSHEKRFFGSKVTVSVHEGVGKISISLLTLLVLFTVERI